MSLYCPSTPLYKGSFSLCLVIVALALGISFFYFYLNPTLTLNPTLVSKHSLRSCSLTKVTFPPHVTIPNSLFGRDPPKVYINPPH